MEIFGLALDEQSQTPIIVLKDSDKKYVLPIWVGALEAMAISMIINKIEMPRPMTHDLFVNVLQQLESRIVRIELISLREGVYYAELVLQKGDGELRIDSRPSDAIALALRVKAPIMAHKSLLEESSGQQEHFQAVLKDPDAEKWTDVLARYSLDDLKYKM